MASEAMEGVLLRAGLPDLKDKFLAEKIDTKLISTLTDEDMVRLGVTTIGDRIRLREEAKRSLQSLDSSSTCVTARLFPGFRSRNTTGTTANKKTSRLRGWTANFYCVSSSEQIKTPNATEKEILNKCGLGQKKIKISNKASEEEVLKLLQSEEGFTKLTNCGGFELLRTLQNGKCLVPVPGPWSSQGLNMNIGPQA